MKKILKTSSAPQFISLTNTESQKSPNKVKKIYII